MAKTIKLVSNNGCGWKVGETGNQVVELTTTHGFSWKASKSGSEQPEPVEAAPENTALPTITGTAHVGETLTATEGTWTGNPAPTYTYQWQADGEDIEGATDATYEPVEDDIDTVITVVVTATNSAGSDSATSAATDPVVAAE